MGPTPFASMLFADLGADVVRVVRPASSRRRAGTTPADDVGPQYDIVNRGVTSVAVDLKEPAGVEAVLGLVRRGGGFLQGVPAPAPRPPGGGPAPPPPAPAPPGLRP